MASPFWWKTFFLLFLQKSIKDTLYFFSVESFYKIRVGKAFSVFSTSRPCFFIFISCLKKLFKFKKCPGFGILWWLLRL
jgi:hypothetical protein